MKKYLLPFLMGVAFLLSLLNCTSVYAQPPIDLDEILICFPKGDNRQHTIDLDLGLDNNTYDFRWTLIDDNGDGSIGIIGNTTSSSAKFKLTSNTVEYAEEKVRIEVWEKACGTTSGCVADACYNCKEIPVIFYRVPEVVLTVNPDASPYCIPSGGSQTVDINAAITGTITSKIDVFPEWTVDVVGASADAQTAFEQVAQDATNAGTYDISFTVDNADFASTSDEITLTVSGISSCDNVPETEVGVTVLVFQRNPDFIGIEDTELCIVDGGDAGEIFAPEEDTPFTYNWNLVSSSGGSLTWSPSGTRNSGLTVSNVAFDAGQATITAEYRLDVAGGCSESNKTAIVTFHKEPEPITLPTLEYCELDGTTNLELITASADDGFTYNWVISNVAGGTFNSVFTGTNGSGLQLDDISFNANDILITADIELTVTSPNCSSNTATTTLTIHRKPQITQTTDITICADQGGSIADVIASVTEPYNYAWSISSESGGTVTFSPTGTNNSGLTFDDIQFNNGEKLITATLTATATNIGTTLICDDNHDINLTIHRNAEPLSATEIIICAYTGDSDIEVISEATQAINDVDYQWAKGTFSYDGVDLQPFGNNNSGLKFNNISFATGESSLTGVVELEITGIDASCNNGKVDVPVTIYRIPSQLAFTAQEVCTTQNSSGVAVFSAGTEVINDFTFTWSEVSATNGSFDLLPTGSDDSGLSLDNVVFDAGQSQIDAVVNLTVTGVNSNCNLSSVDIPITLYRIPEQFSQSAITFCTVDGSTDITGVTPDTDVISGYTYTWSFSETGGNVSLQPTGLNGSGVDFSLVQFDATSSEISGTLTLEVNGINGACGLSSVDIPVTITRTPDQLSITDVTLCEENNTASLDIFTANGSVINGWTYQWNLTNLAGGTLTAEAYGNNDSGLRFKDLAFTGTSNVVTATLELTVDGSSCQTIPHQIPVTIHRQVNMDEYTDVISCQYNNATAIDIFSGINEEVDGYDFQWTLSNESGGSFALEAYGINNSVLRFNNLSFTGGSSQITATLDLTITGIDNSCTTTTKSIPVTLYRVPEQFSQSAIDFCTVDGSTNITGVASSSEVITGYTYDWSFTGSGGTVTLSTTGTDNSGVDFATVNFDATSSAITGTLRLEVTGMNASCTSSVDIPVTISRTPDQLSITDVTLCEENNTASLDIFTANGSVINGWTYQWNLTNLAGGTFTAEAYGNNDSGIRFKDLSFTGTSNVVTATLELTVDGSSCQTTPHQIPVTIHRQVNMDEYTDVISCQYNNATAIDIFSGINEEVEGYDFQWTLSNESGGSFALEAYGINNSALRFNNLSFTGGSSQITATLDLTITGIDNSCTTTTKSIPVTLYRVPEQFAQSAIDFCTVDGSTNITGVASSSEVITGYTYDWSFTGSGGTVTLSTTGTDNSGVDFATVSFDATSSAITGTLRLEVTGMNASCTSSVDIPVTISRTPDQLSITDVILCEENNTASLDIFTANGSVINGWTYQWNLTNQAGGTFTAEAYGNNDSGIRFKDLSFTGTSNVVTATLELTVAGSSCQTIPHQIPVTIHRQVNMDEYTDVVSCQYNNTTSLDIFSGINEEVDGYDFQWTLSNVSGGSFALETHGHNASGLRFNDVLFTGGNSQITATLDLTITGVDNSCTTTSKSIPVTLYRVPEQFAQSAIDFCTVDGSTNITGVASSSEVITGYTYDWSFTGSGGTVTLSTTGTDNSGVDFATVNFDATSSAITGTLRLEVTGMNASCTSSVDIPVTISRTPDQLSITDVTLCEENNTASLDIFTPNGSAINGWTYEWTLTNLAGGTFTAEAYGNNDSGIRFKNLVFTGTSNIVTATLELTVDGSSCQTIPHQIPVTIHRQVNMGEYTDVVSCQYNNATAIDIFSGISEEVDGYDFQWSLSNLSGGTFNWESFGHNASGLRFNNLSFTGGSSQITATLDLTITGVDNSCTTTSKSIPVTLYRIPEQFAQSAIDFCTVDGSTNITGVASSSEVITGYTYDWSFTGSGGVVTLSTTGTDNSGVDFATVNFDATSSAITGTLRLEVTGMNASCTSSVDIPVTISRTPDQLSITDVTLCEENNTASLDIFTPNGSAINGWTYQWNLTNKSGGDFTIEAYDNNDSGLRFKDISFIGTSNQITAILELTVDGSPCQTTPHQIPITINRQVNLDSYTDIISCQYNNTATFDLFTEQADLVDGYSYQWSLNNLSGGSVALEPFGNNDSGLRFNNLTFTGGNSQITATLDLTITGMDNACTTTSKSIPVTLYRVPDQFAQSAITFCAFDGDTNITGVAFDTEVISGYTYDWSFSGNGGTVTLSPTGTNDSGVDFASVNFNATASEITGTLRLEVTGMNASCTSSVDIPVTISRTPEQFNITDITLCQENNTTGINVSSPNASVIDGFDYQWNLVSISGGTFDVEKYGNNNSGLKFNNLSFTGISNVITATIELSVSGTACQTTPHQIPVTIHRQVNLDEYTTVATCEYDGTTALEVFAGKADLIDGYDFQWEASNVSGGSLTLEAFGNNNSGLLFNDITFTGGSSQLTGTLDLIVTGMDNSCVTTTKSIPFTIHYKPEQFKLTGITITLCEVNGTLVVDAVTANNPAITDYDYSWNFKTAPSGGSFTIEAYGDDNSGLYFKNISFDANSEEIQSEITMDVTGLNPLCGSASLDIPVVIQVKAKEVTISETPLCLEDLATNTIAIEENANWQTGVTYTWEVSNVQGGQVTASQYGANNTGLLFDEVDFDNGSTQITYTLTLTQKTDCSEITQTKNLVINRKPDLSSYVAQTLCLVDGETGIELYTEVTETVNDFTYKWSIVSVNSSGGSFTIEQLGADLSGVRLNDLSFDAGSSQITAQLQLEVTGGCETVVQTVDILINRKADIADYSALTLDLCQFTGDSDISVIAPITDNISGFTYEWDYAITSGGSFDIVPYGNNNSGLELENIQFGANQTVIEGTITLVNVDGSCEAVTETIPIKIERKLDASLISDNVLCLINNPSGNIEAVAESLEDLLGFNYAWQVDAKLGGSFDIASFGKNSSGLNINNVVFDNGSNQIVAKVLVSIEGGCEVTSDEVEIVINRKADLSTYADINLCQLFGDTNIQVFTEGDEVVTGITYTWNIVANSLTGGQFTPSSLGADGSGLEINDVTFESGSSQITAQLQITSSGGCEQVSKTLNVEIIRKPTVTTITQIDGCLAEGESGFTAIEENTESIPDFDYTWTLNVDEGGSLDIAKFGNQNSGLTFNNIHFDDNSQEIKGEITVQVNGGCGADPLTIPFTIQRKSSLDQLTDLTLCQLEGDSGISAITAETESLIGWSYNWSLLSSSGGSITISPSGNMDSGLTINDIDFKEGSSQITAQVYVEVTGSCNTPSKTISVVIDRKADVSGYSSTAIDLCQYTGDSNISVVAPITENISGFTYQWSRAVTSGGSFDIIPYGNNDSGIELENIQFEANQTLIEGVITIVNVDGSCETVTTDIPITIERRLDATLIPDNTLCLIHNPSGAIEAITASSERLDGFNYTWELISTTGGNFDFSAKGNNNSGLDISNVLFETGSNQIVTKLKVSISGGCEVVSDEVEITINRKADLSTYTDISLCQLFGDTNIEVVPAGSEVVNGITYIWKIVDGSVLGGTFTTASLGVDGSGLEINDVTFESGSSQITAQLQITSSGGCEQVSKTLNVEIIRKPTVTTITQIDGCLAEGESGFTAIEENIESIPDFIYTWTLNVDAGGSLDIAKFGNQDSGLTFNNIHFDNNSQQITGTVTVRVDGGCGADPLTIPFTIQRKSSLDQLTDLTLCQLEGDSGISAITAETELLTGWSYNWSLLSSSGGSITISPSGNMDSGLTINSVDFNDNSSQVTAQVYVEITGSCETSSKTITVVIDRKADVSGYSSMTVDLCQYTGDSNISVVAPITENISGFTYQWSRAVTSGGSFDIIPYGNNDSGIELENIQFEANQTLIEGVITIVNVDGSCETVTTDIPITIERRLDATLIPDNTLCLIHNPSGAIEAITASSERLDGFNYTWELISTSGGSFDFLAKGNNNSGLDINNVLFETGSNQIVTKLKVSIAGGCEVVSDEVEITINRKADLSTYTDISLCQLFGDTNIEVVSAGSEIVTGIAYTWKIVDGSVLGGTFTTASLGVDGSGLEINDVTFESGSSQITAQLQITSSGGCEQVSKTLNVEIIRKPTVTTITQIDGCLAEGESGFTAIEENTESIPDFEYTWTLNVDTGGSLDIAKFGNQNSGLTFNNIHFDNGSQEITGVVTVRVNGGCGADPLTIPFSIKRKSALANFTDITLCQFDGDSGILAVTEENEVLTDWVYDWALTSSSGGFIALNPTGNMNSGLLIDDITFGNGSNQITAEVFVTVTGGCDEISKTLNVVINRKPDLSYLTNVTLCANETEQVVAVSALSETITGFTYTWEKLSESGGTLSFSQVNEDGNVEANASGLAVHNSLFDNGSSKITAQFKLTAVGCESISKTVTVVVHRALAFETPLTYTYCAEEEAIFEAVTGEIDLFDFTWEVQSISGAVASMESTLTTQVENITSPQVSGLTVTNSDFLAGAGIIEVQAKLSMTNKAFPTCTTEQIYTIQFTEIPEIILPSATAEGCSEENTTLKPFGDEDMSDTFEFEWKLVVGSVTGMAEATLEQMVNSYTGQDLVLLIEDNMFDDENTQQITFEVELAVTNKVLQKCFSNKSSGTYSMLIYRKPLVELDTQYGGCENDVAVISSNYNQLSHLDYQWTVSSKEGGVLNGVVNDQYEQSLTATFYDNSYEVRATLDLAVENTLITGGCIGEASTTVLFQKAPDARFEMQNTLGCSEQVTVFDASTSGIPSGENTYEWDFDYNGTFTVDASSKEQTIEHSFQGEGDYTVALRITTSLGCQSEVTTESFTIHPSPQSLFTAVDEICIDEPFTVNNTSVAGIPNGALTYRWFSDYTNDATTVYSTDVNPTFTYTQKGTYTIALEVTNELGCATTSIWEVDVVDLNDVIVSSDVVICVGEEVTLTVDGGSRWDWSTGSNANNITVSPTESTDYIVTTYSDNCHRVDTIQVNVIPSGLLETVQEGCEGETVTLSAGINYDGIAQRVIWEDGTEGTTFRAIEAGRYKYTSEVYFPEADKTCEYQGEVQLIMHALPPTVLPKETTFCFDDDAEIELSVTNNPNYIYYWEDTGETTYNVKRGTEGWYSVIITDLSTDNECQIKDEVYVREVCPPKIYAPTAFSPNGDGLNDEFIITSKDLINIHLTIYNRWGEIIFYEEYKDTDDLKDARKAWNGIYRDKKVPHGTYLYTLKYENEFYEGEIFEEQRSITVMY